MSKKCVYTPTYPFQPEITYKISAILIKTLTQQADPKIHMEEGKDEIQE